MAESSRKLGVYEKFHVATSCAMIARHSFTPRPRIQCVSGSGACALVPGVNQYSLNRTCPFSPMAGSRNRKQFANLVTLPGEMD